MSLNLKDVCDQFDCMNFPAAQERKHPDLETVRLARETIEQAIKSESFILDCIKHELTLIETEELGAGLIPFFVHPNKGIQFSFGYWSPGASPGPHVHTAWTLTAVCKNTLNVVTYETEPAVRDGVLVAQKNIDAKQGQVGFIHDICVHNPTNTSSQWSWTLHVTSPRDGEDSEQFPNERFRFETETQVDRKHPFAEVIRVRQRMTRIRYLSSVLASFISPSANKLKDRCSRLGTRLTQKQLRNGRKDDINQTDISCSPHRLKLTHKNLELHCHQTEDSVSLMVDTPEGSVAAVQMDSIAEPALQYVAKQGEFDVRSLPGIISNEEQHQIGDMLENLGLFRSVI